MGEGGCRKIRPDIKLKPAENKAGYKNLSPSENKAGHPFQVRRKIRPGIQPKSAGEKGRADALLRGQKKTGLPKMRKGRPMCGPINLLRPAVKSQAKERSAGEDDLAGHVEQKGSPETFAPAVCGPTREKPPPGSETAAKNRKTEPKSSPGRGKKPCPGTAVRTGSRPWPPSCPPFAGQTGRRPQSRPCGRRAGRPRRTG